MVDASQQGILDTLAVGEKRQGLARDKLFKLLAGPVVKSSIPETAKRLRSPYDGNDYGHRY